MSKCPTTPREIYEAAYRLERRRSAIHLHSLPQISKYHPTNRLVDDALKHIDAELGSLFDLQYRHCNSSQAMFNAQRSLAKRFCYSLEPRSNRILSLLHRKRAGLSIDVWNVA
jgi:hypothetical protein